MLPALNPEIQQALVKAIALLGTNSPTELLDRFLSRVMAQGVSADVRPLCGNVIERLVIFAIGNDAASKAGNAALIALLQQGVVIDKFNATVPVLQQCYLLEHNGLRVLLIIRPR